VTPYSKETQLANSPGGNRTCTATGKPKRSCDCFSCRGRRNRSKGKRTQREARKGLEKVFRSSAGPTLASTADEENWRLPVRPEVKSGITAAPVGTFYRNTKAQSDAKKAIADLRPFAAVASIDGESDQLVVIRMSDLQLLFDEARR
jgi:hypothetical protein